MKTKVENNNPIDYWYKKYLEEKIKRVELENKLKAYEDKS